MVTERWLPIPGYEGQYEVSDCGRVRSLERIVMFRDGRQRTVKARILTPQVNWLGYRTVSMANTTRRIHQLVLAAFVGPRPPGMVCRHLNDIKTDNRVENLAYGTQSENNRDAIANGNHRQVNKSHCPNGHPYAGDNLITRPCGRRQCRECKRAYQFRKYWSNRPERVRSSKIAQRESR